MIIIMQPDWKRIAEVDQGLINTTVKINNNAGGIEADQVAYVLDTINGARNLIDQLAADVRRLRGLLGAQHQYTPDGRFHGRVPGCSCGWTPADVTPRGDSIAQAVWNEHVTYEIERP